MFRIEGPDIDGRWFVFEAGRDLYPAAGPFGSENEARAAVREPYATPDGLVWQDGRCIGYVHPETGTWVAHSGHVIRAGTGQRPAA